ncbi:ribonuclease III domain-containing protein [Zychaea mexicana]|uniref:ribonuclease III domain-containing protein n=1 Tax=Zychaea mexicana TaxID=64656 RepID=UPI0022FE2464|nr:ribonuclease III domain-containing protein [Zychaea mexicana]KAI9493752.1 ribonuclease III domain-containing protein [Zychaea mexicana]
MLRTVLGRRSFHSTFLNRAEKTASPDFNVETASQHLGVSFTTPNLLQRALTHKSFKHGTVPTNERLEFLGSRVVSLLATEQAVKNNAVDLKEQVVTQTSATNLAHLFDTLNLESGLQYHLPDGVTPKVKANVYKAVVGAVYHDKGFSAAREFVQKHLS